MNDPDKACPLYYRNGKYTRTTLPSKKYKYLPILWNFIRLMLLLYIGNVHHWRLNAFVKLILNLKGWTIIELQILISNCDTRYYKIWFLTSHYKTKKFLVYLQWFSVTIFFTPLTSILRCQRIRMVKVHILIIVVII